MLSKEQLTGPWAGLPVSWKDDGSFDEKIYRENVRRTCKANVPGIYTAGTTGEFYAMEFDEFKAVTKATIDECKEHSTPCMIGISSTYTLGAQRRAECAVEMGADAVQVAMPYWMEIDDREVLTFFKEVKKASDPLALTIYETKRSKKSLTLQQHKEIKDAVPEYLAVKSNEGTYGCSVEGCKELSKFVNVWVGEEMWSELGPAGAIGCASALVYMNPRFTLNMFELLKAKKWEHLKVFTEMLSFYFAEGLKPFFDRGYVDSALDHMQGLVAGFLTGSPLSRGPYVSATTDDVKALKQWVENNAPELLKL